MILVLLGAAVSDGLLRSVTPAMVAVVVAFLFVVRPLSSMIALGGASDGRWITSFFGIRGVGSLFYLSYALVEHDFPVAEQLWAVVGLTVLMSVAIHGLSAGPVMHRYDRRRQQEEAGSDIAGDSDAAVAGSS